MLYFALLWVNLIGYHNGQVVGVVRPVECGQFEMLPVCTVYIAAIIHHNTYATMCRPFTQQRPLQVRRMPMFCMATCTAPAQLERRYA